MRRYSRQFGVEAYIEGKQSDIEHFAIGHAEYDYIVAVSALEHVSTEDALRIKLGERVRGTKKGGVNCIIISSNIRETDIESGKPLDPMFEVNLPTDYLLALLDARYGGWRVLHRLVKQLEYTIDRAGRPVKLTSDCITYAAKNEKAGGDRHG